MSEPLCTCGHPQTDHAFNRYECGTCGWMNCKKFTPPARSRDDAEKAIAAVLLEHDDWLNNEDGTKAICDCGATVSTSNSWLDCEDAHRAHVASVLADLMADAWDEARDAVLTGFVPESEHEFRGLYPNPYRVPADTPEGDR